MKRFAIAIALVATLVVGGSLGASNAQAAHPHHHHHHHHHGGGFGGYGYGGGYGGYGGHYHYHSNYRPYGYSNFGGYNQGCNPGYGYGGGRNFSLYFGGY